MRYIAFIDILGFCQFVKTHDLKEIVNAYAPILTGLHHATQGARPVFKGLNYQVFSDSLCILTDDDSPELLYELVMCCHLQLFTHYYLLRNGVSEQLPVRGYIAKGEFIFGEHQFSTQAMGRERITTKAIPTLLGKGLVEAADWEKQQEWIGISLCPELYRELKSRPDVTGPCTNRNLLIRYNVPVKDNKSHETLAVNPVERFHVDHVINELDALETKGGLHLKAANSLKFIKHIRTNDLAIPKMPPQKVGVS